MFMDWTRPLQFGTITCFPFVTKSSLVTSPLTGMPKRDLIVLQGRKRTVSPQALPGLYTNPALNPFLPIPSEHAIVRVNRKKEWILLENEGILQVGIKFNISDRKKMGVTNKVRKLTLGFKIVSNNFKQVLMDYINNGYNTPIGPPFFAGVKGLQQTFKGRYNGVDLSVTLTQAEFGDNLAIIRNGQDNTENYLKVVTYKFHQAWLLLVNQVLNFRNLARILV